MQISGIIKGNERKQTFGQLKTHYSLFDKSIELIQNEKTRDIFVSTYNELKAASGDRNLEIRALGENGGVVAETDEEGNVLRYISKNFHNLISSMKDAVLKLNKENNPKSSERKKPFIGNY